MSSFRKSVINLIIILFDVAYCDEYEYQLYEDLLKNYDPLERPTPNNSRPVRVTLGIDLQQIVNLDEKNQILELNAWLNYNWHDYKMKWNPDEYGGVSDVRFPKHEKDGYPLWTPDVLLYNSVDQAFDTTYPSNLVVYSNGLVNWIPPGILKISCKIDITWFPFDDQSCFLKFGSWTYHEEALDLQPAANVEGINLSEYIESGEWSIISAPVKRTVKYFDCCPEAYPTLTFYLNIRRRTLYYGCNLILPSFLMSLMTVLGFILPPDACEKITLEITILLSVCVFLSFVSNITPPTSEAIPLLGLFFFCSLVLVSLSVIFSVLVLNLHFRTSFTHHMSPIVRAVLLNYVPWLLMMKRPGYKFQRQSLAEAYRKASAEHGLEEKGGGGVHSLLESRLSIASQNPLIRNVLVHRKQSLQLEHKIRNILNPYIANNQTLDPLVGGMLVMLERLHSQLKSITKRMEEEDKEFNAESDWKFAAMVVDRMCLIMFSVFIVLTTGAIIFSAPFIVT